MSSTEQTAPVRERREAFWRDLGEVHAATGPWGEESVDVPTLWPGGRSAYRRVITEHAGIVTTDGLSDPFDGGPEDGPGLGVELYVEGRELVEDLATEGLWLVRALEEAAGALVGASASLPAALAEHELLSLELSGVDAPEGWVADGRMGALLGVPLPARPRELDVDGTIVRMLCLSPLRPEELAVVTAEGATGRQRVAEALAASGWYSYAEAVREPVV